MDFPILTFITFIPILGMVLILFLPNTRVQMIKSITLLATGLQVVFSIILLVAFDYSLGGINDASSFQFVEKFRWINIEGFPWIGTIKIDYFMGVDGLSTPLVLLTAIVTFIATLSSWNISKSIKGYFALFLLLDTGMMGVFVSLDFFLFFVFWEIMLTPNVLSYWNLGRPKKRICSY